ncbi:hypothetical protein Tco_0266398 [Tanacetum coccineum]
MFSQFWATAKAKTVNGEVQIQALVDRKKVIVTETSVRRALQLKYAEGTKCLLNATIFEQLTLMGAKTTAWNEFSSTMASTVICLATNQKFNFSKYIFDNIVNNMEGGVKFLMYPRKDTEVHQPSGSTKPITDEAANEEHVPTHSNDPLFSDLSSSEITKLKGNEGQEAERRECIQTGDKKFADLDADAEVTLIDEAQGRNDDNLMFDTCVLDEHEVVVEKVVSTTEVTTASATTTTTAVTRPKARGVVVQEPSEFRATTSSSQTSQLPHAKDKGKGKMVEPEKHLKKKDQILINVEIAQKLQAQLHAELEEEEKLAKQRLEDANIAEWDNVQAIIDADYELAARL